MDDKYPQIIRESCIVALDMYEHEISGNFQYANGVEEVKNASTAPCTVEA